MNRTARVRHVQFYVRQSSRTCTVLHPLYYVAPALKQRGVYCRPLGRCAVVRAGDHLPYSMLHCERKVSKNYSIMRAITLAAALALAACQVPIR
jgi:hypothetical protein